MRPDEKTLTVGISSRALFSLEDENHIYEQTGLREYIKYQRGHETDILAPGTGFPLVKALLRLNSLADRRVAEVVIMSHNNADTGLRIFNSIEHYGLDITRAVLSGGQPVAPYMNAFKVDLLLSCDEADVSAAVQSGAAAGRICVNPELSIDPAAEIDCIRIAFDGDAVLFGSESERIYKEKGLEAFAENERTLRDTPLSAGPFAPFLTALSALQEEFGQAPIRTALVTARNAPAHERVIKTLRSWNVKIDEMFFMGGMSKAEVLRAFGAHIFFDDQRVHTDTASGKVPSAQVPFV